LALFSRRTAVPGPETEKLALFGAVDDTFAAAALNLRREIRNLKWRLPQPPRLALIGFAFPRHPRFSPKTVGNWVCFARMMTPRNRGLAGSLPGLS
jgi:hypothetical protein